MLIRVVLQIQAELIQPTDMKNASAASPHFSPGGVEYW